MSQFAAMRGAVSGAPHARVGLGGAALLAQSLGTSSTVSSLVNASGAQGSAQDALQSGLQTLSPDTLNALSGSIDAVNNLAPMANFAASIAQGGSMSGAEGEQMVVGMLALTATMTMGPIAGAAVAAAAEVATLIFDALQGPPPPPPTEWNYRGFLRAGLIQGSGVATDPVPYGPKDPSWMHFTNARQVIDAVVHGTGTPSSVPIDGNFAFGTAALWAVCLELCGAWPVLHASIQRQKSAGGAIDTSPINLGLWNYEDAEALYASSSINTFESGSNILGGYNSPNGNDFRGMYLCYDSLYGLQETFFESLFYTGGVDPEPALVKAEMAGDAGTQAAFVQYYTPAHLEAVDPDFSVLFAATLARDIEQWANGHSYIDPYQLLLACVAAWNATHGSDRAVTYDPYDYYASGKQLTYSGAHNGLYSSYYDIQPGDVKDLVSDVFFWRNPIYTILRGWQFDVANPAAAQLEWHPPIVLNVGAPMNSNIKGSTGVGGALWQYVDNLPLGVKIALGIASVPVVAVAGGTGYALVTRQPVKRVLGGMWKSTKKPFVSAGHTIGSGAKRLVGR